MKISTNTATGVMSPATVLAGGRAPSSWDGLRIASVTGSTSAPGAGHGSKTSLGDSLPSTTDAGRSSDSGWFWVPGPVVVRPVWAPALVAFVGGGPGFHFSAGVGVGWFPLAPGEVYLPGYRVSRAYVNNVNITNTTVSVTRVTNVYNTVIVNRSTTINNVTYVNQRVNNGVTVVSHDAFVNARPVAQNIMRVDPREIAAAPVSHVVAAEPVRTSVFGAGRPASVRPPAAVISRPVVAVRTPPPPPRPIEQRQAQAGGHLNQQALVRPAGPAQPAQTNQGGRPAATQEGFRPFTPSNSAQQSGQADAADATASLRAAGNSAARKPECAAAAGNRNAPACEPRFRPPQPEQVSPAPQRRIRWFARAAGAGAQPATGTTAGAEVQSMAPAAACDSSACAEAGSQPSGSGPPKQEKSEEVALTLTPACGLIRFAGDALANQMRPIEANAGRSASSPGVFFCGAALFLAKLSSKYNRDRSQ